MRLTDAEQRQRAAALDDLRAWIEETLVRVTDVALNAPRTEENLNFLAGMGHTISSLEALSKRLEALRNLLPR